jgi:hypothetical protein
MDHIGLIISLLREYDFNHFYVSFEVPYDELENKILVLIGIYYTSTHYAFRIKENNQFEIELTKRNGETTYKDRFPIEEVEYRIKRLMQKFNILSKDEKIIRDIIE